MPNRRLTALEIAGLNELQARTVTDLNKMAGGDAELLFALRRWLFTRLMHLERGTPAQRTKLKAAKWKAQNGRCGICNEVLEQKGSELDRFQASAGYTAANTRLVHHVCHVEDQRKKGFSDAEAEIAEALEDWDEASNLVDSCEIKKNGVWTAIGVGEALSFDGGEHMRCPACHGRVRPHALGSTMQRAHFEHFSSWAGCKLKATGMVEGSKLHPQALE